MISYDVMGWDESELYFFKTNLGVSLSVKDQWCDCLSGSGIFVVGWEVFISEENYNLI